MVYLINPNRCAAPENNFISFGPSMKQMTYSKEFNEGIIYRDVKRVKGANQGLTPVSRSQGEGGSCTCNKVTAVPLREGLFCRSCGLRRAATAETAGYGDPILSSFLWFPVRACYCLNPNQKPEGKENWVIQSIKASFLGHCREKKKKEWRMNLNKWWRERAIYNVPLL